MTSRQVKLDPIVEIEGFTKTTNKAVVLEVGEGCSVEVGDKVLIPTTNLASFNNEDGVYMYIFEEEIIAIIE